MSPGKADKKVPAKKTEEQITQEWAEMCQWIESLQKEWSERNQKEPASSKRS